MTVISANKFAAIDWKAPELPEPVGLFANVNWVTEAIPRWFDSGVLVERTNFDADTGYGLWNPAWNASAAVVEASNQVKTGTRPDRDDTPFTHATAYAYAKNPCGDLRADTRAETTDRSERLLTRSIQKTVETAFATRLWADVGADGVATQAAADIIEAVSNLERDIADQGVNTALIHASPKWAAYLVGARLVQLRADGWHTPLGHLVVFGAGYDSVLVDSLIATTPVAGWRTDVTAFNEILHTTNEYISIHEQSVLLAYEQVLTATQIS